jgi:membrane-associated phospholipid phosphatase
MNIKQKYIIGIVIALIIIFVTEIFYRRPLYDLSVKYISKIKQTGFFHKFYIFWANDFNKIINYTGIFFTILFCPLNTFFSHLSSQYILDFVNGIFKSLYSNERPFWDIYIDLDNNTKWNTYTNTSLTKLTECNTSFGNPSGHAMRATYLLILWNLFINSKYFNKLADKKKIILKYITLFLSALGIFFVLYSRINRQAHSFNQIIFGTLIGASIFFILCYILEINK